MMFEEVFKPLSAGIIIPPVGGGHCPVNCDCTCTESDPKKTDDNQDMEGETV